MNRKNFILKLSKGTAAFAVCSCMSWSCEAESDGITAPDPPTGVDFIIDINDPPNSALQNTGGFIYKNGIIIANTGGNFIAFQQACTHQGTTIRYEHNNSRFHCPNHGSNFSITGSIINGPAARNLKMYSIEVNGNILRVFD